MVLGLILTGVLGAAVRGVLAGAWDRYLLDKMAFQTEATLGSVSSTLGGGTYRGPPGGSGFRVPP